MKLASSDQLIKHQREQEDLRAQLRVLTSEAERLAFKQQAADEEKLKCIHKVERKTQEVSALQLEKGGLTQTLREKDLLIE